MLLHRKVDLPFGFLAGRSFVTMFGPTRAALNTSAKSKDEDAKHDIAKEKKPMKNGASGGSNIRKSNS